uniref:Uncharacterized protein n=1 Tax=viral metagenome TaxID=1070528 RepID=A0A6M3LMZ8_9ZZZZ
MTKKSKTDVDVIIKEVHVPSYQNRIVLFTGATLPQEFIKFGEGIGFKCRAIKEYDISVLVKARILVAFQLPTYTFQEHLNIINLARQYDVTTVWCDKYSYPWQWMASFDIVLVGNISPGFFWRTVAEWIV